MNFLNIFATNQISLIDSMAQEIMLTNEMSQAYGLSLSQQEAKEIIIARENTLKEYDRVEIDTEILNKLVLAFCSSPYIQQSQYMDTIIELQELFHYIKNEVNDGIGDDALIEVLCELFNHKCHGDLELLQGRVTEKIIRQYRFGDEEEESEEYDDDSQSKYDPYEHYFEESWEDKLWNL